MTNEELQDTRAHVWAMFAASENNAIVTGALVAEAVGSKATIIKENTTVWELVEGNADKMLAEWDKRFGKDGKDDRRFGNGER